MHLAGAVAFPAENQQEIYATYGCFMELIWVKPCQNPGFIKPYCRLFHWVVIAFKYQMK